MLKWLKCVTRLKSYRCTSTSQDWILLSLIKQDDPKATGGLRHFSRGENWIFYMLVHGNSTTITPQRCLHLGLRADATAVPEVGWDLVGLVCSFWWLLSFPGNNPGPAYGKERMKQQKGRSVPEKNVLNRSMHGSGNGQLTPARGRFYQWRDLWVYNQHPCTRVEEGSTAYHICALFLSFTQEIWKTAMEMLAFNVQKPFKEDHRAGVSIC